MIFDSNFVSHTLFISRLVGEEENVSLVATFEHHIPLPGIFHLKYDTMSSMLRGPNPTLLLVYFKMLRIR